MKNLMTPNVKLVTYTPPISHLSLQNPSFYSQKSLSQREITPENPHTAIALCNIPAGILHTAIALCNIPAGIPHTAIAV